MRRTIVILTVLAMTVGMLAPAAYAHDETGTQRCSVSTRLKATATYLVKVYEKDGTDPFYPYTQIYSNYHAYEQTVYKILSWLGTDWWVHSNHGAVNHAQTYGYCVDPS
jgi:hypothetical protein